MVLRSVSENLSILKMVSVDFDESTDAAIGALLDNTWDNLTDGWVEFVLKN